MAQLVKTAFKEVKFVDCKILGLRFDDCNGFGMSSGIDNCTLNHSSFYQVKLKKNIFKNTQLHEVDFTLCDITGSVFEHCDFTGATFDNTVIEKVDFRTSINYSCYYSATGIKYAFAIALLPKSLLIYRVIGLS
ncbi:MAG: pentapeptide repeat-containing protein [Taibaiella sp.]|nr:pentapeptide repeat-containing protein [Taibaiella sp.]